MEEIGFWTTVTGLLNGMIGGGCLALPVIALNQSPFTILLASLWVGTYSFYTAYLVVAHMGKAPTIKQALLLHFDYNPIPMKLYNLITWVKFIFFISFLYKLICLQVVGLLGYSPWWASIAVAVLVVVLASLLRAYNAGQEVISLGILSNIALVLFIFWMLLTSPQAPPSAIPEPQHDGSSLVKLISVLMTSFILHALLPQNIVKNPNRQQYPYIMLTTFIISVTIYTFVMWGGSAGIAHRVSFKAHPQTVEDFFESGGWEVTFIEGVYLLQLLTAIPYVLIVSNVRFGQLIDRQLRHEMSFSDVVYFAVMVGAAFAIFESGLYLDVLLSVYGAVFGFLFVIAMPVALHWYCLFWKKESGWIKDGDSRNEEIVQSSCACDLTYRSLSTLYLETGLLGLVTLFGLTMMCYTLSKVIAA